MYPHETGKLGEELACRYLTERGFRVVERNYTRPWGEIDVVAEKGSVLHFCEVKSQKTAHPNGESVFNPAEKVDKRKAARLSRSVQTYLSERKLSHDTDFQVDILIVRINPDTKKARITCLSDVIFE